MKKKQQSTAQLLSFKLPHLLPALFLSSMPVYVSLEREGIRIIKWNERIVFDSLTIVRNKNITEQLVKILPDGAECTILANNSLEQTKTLLNSDTEIQADVVVLWNDWIKEKSFVTPFAKRIQNIDEYKLKFYSINFIRLFKNQYIFVEERSLLLDLVKDAIERRKRGIFVYDPGAPYIQGKSSTFALYRFK